MVEGCHSFGVDEDDLAADLAPAREEQPRGPFVGPVLFLVLGDDLVPLEPWLMPPSERRLAVTPDIGEGAVRQSHVGDGAIELSWPCECDRTVDDRSGLVGRADLSGDRRDYAERYERGDERRESGATNPIPPSLLASHDQRDNDSADGCGQDAEHV